MRTCHTQYRWKFEALDRRYKQPYRQFTFRTTEQGISKKSIQLADAFNRFWEALSGICSRTIPHPDSQVNRLAISPDKRYLAAAGHHTVKLYDIKSTNPAAVLSFEGHTSNITGVAFHCETKWMVTSSEDGMKSIEIFTSEHPGPKFGTVTNWKLRNRQNLGHTLWAPPAELQPRRASQRRGDSSQPRRVDLM